jgi:hypothetical protein
MATKASGSYTITSYQTPSGIPNGRCCGRINNFVLIGAITTDIYAVQWCQIAVPTVWPTPNTDDARSKQAGLETLSNAYGQVTAIADGDFFGYVFQERGITKFTYVGGELVFTVDVMEENRGCIRSGRMAQTENRIFFESDRGYHMLDFNSGQIVDIGYGKVDDSY